MKSGGVIEQYVHAIEIVCLPDDLPETLEIDISGLQLGDSLHVGEIKYPKGVRTTHAADVVIVHIGRAGSGAETRSRHRGRSPSRKPDLRGYPIPSPNARAVPTPRAFFLVKAESDL